MRYSPKGKFLASSGWDNRIKLWSAQTYQHLQSHQTNNSDIHALSFSPNGRFLASSGPTQLDIWETETLNLITSYTSDEFKHLHWFRRRLIGGNDQASFQTIELDPQRLWNRTCQRLTNHCPTSMP